MDATEVETTSTPTAHTYQLGRGSRQHTKSAPSGRAYNVRRAPPAPCMCVRLPAMAGSAQPDGHTHLSDSDRQQGRGASWPDGGLDGHGSWRGVPCSCLQQTPEPRLSSDASTARDEFNTAARPKESSNIEPNTHAERLAESGEAKMEGCCNPLPWCERQSRTVQ
jgi:hypothetical protein